MRKFVTLALAAVFVLGMATYTLATEFEFGGSYRIRGLYWQDGIDPMTRVDINNDGTDDERVDDVNYFDNRLRLEMDAKVSDRLSAHVQADSGLGYGGDYRYHNPFATQDSYDGVWGRAYGPERFQDTAGGTALGLNAGGWPYEADSVDEAMGYQSHDIVLQRAYLKYEHPWVTLKAGRQWAHWGSGILESMNRNRIEFMVEKPTWFVGVGMDKMEEGNISIDEDDENLYFASMGYTGEKLQIGQRFEWVTENEPDATGGTHQNNVDLTTTDVNHYALSWYWKLRMGDLGFDGEYCYQWGHTGNWNLPTAALSENLNAHGLTGDLWCNLDSAKVGMQFGYFSGDGNPADDTNNFYITPYNFSPFLLIGEVPINGVTLTGRNITQARSYYDQGWMGNYMSNCWFWKWYGECAPTKNLSVTGAVGYARANQAINRGEDGAMSDGESIGTEMDITATYKLTDNLSYTACWGYLFTGGFYDTRDAGTSITGALGMSEEAANTYVFLHQIAITF